VLNAANESAVAAFLESQLRFDQIPQLIEHVLATIGTPPLVELADVFEADRCAHECAGQWLARHARTGSNDRARVTA
jgi:1-deoxy-D-xylulose-5-phosphate reductoisomerase